MAISPNQVVAVLLAAGRSERFGSDKLVQLLLGKPLALHAAENLAALPFACLIAVTGGTQAELRSTGFRIVRMAEGSPMSASLRTGIAAAREVKPAACLIALADMPFVPPSHYSMLLAAHDGGITATASGDRLTVPAVIAASRFAAVDRLQGDEGARSLLRHAKAVPARPNWLIDIDTPEDLRECEELASTLG